MFVFLTVLMFLCLVIPYKVLEHYWQLLVESVKRRKNYQLRQYLLTGILHTVLCAQSFIHLITVKLVSNKREFSHKVEVFSQLQALIVVQSVLRPTNTKPIFSFLSAVVNNFETLPWELSPTSYFFQPEIFQSFLAAANAA